MSATHLLRRAYDFAAKATTLDFNEDRCVMWAIHLAEDIRAYLLANNISAASADTHAERQDAEERLGPKDG